MTKKSEEKKLAGQMLYMIKPPIIVPPGYEDSVTEDQRNKHQLEAMLNQKVIFETQQASDFDAMLYLSNLSQIHPFTHETAQIYEYLFSRYYDIESVLGKKAPVLEDMEKLELAKLKSWIFKKQIEHLRSKL